MPYPPSADHTVRAVYTLPTTGDVDISGDTWDTNTSATCEYISSMDNLSVLPHAGFTVVPPYNHPRHANVYSGRGVVLKALIETPATPIEGAEYGFTNLGFGSDDPLGLSSGSAWRTSGYGSYRAIYTNEKWRMVGVRIENQANSAAPDVTTLKSDFNALLLKLRQAGVMIP